MTPEEAFLPTYEGQPEPVFLQALEAWVAHLIARDPERLRQILYRIDVSESDAGNAALSAEPARELARLIAVRQIRKWRYRQQNPPAPPQDDADLLW